MIHPNANDTLTVRSVFIIGPDKKVKLIITYPRRAGPQLRRDPARDRLAAAHRRATAWRRRSNWKDGEDVIIVPGRVRRGRQGEVPEGLEGGEALPAAHAPAEQVERTTARDACAPTVVYWCADRRDRQGRLAAHPDVELTWPVARSDAPDVAMTADTSCSIHGTATRHCDGRDEPGTPARRRRPIDRVVVRVAALRPHDRTTSRPQRARGILVVARATRAKGVWCGR